MSNGETDPNEQFRFGMLYYQGKNGIKVNYETANQWFKDAAVQGHPRAQFMLGCAYYNGRGIEQNFNLAIDWLKKVEHLYVDAQVILGFCFLNGDHGIEPDIDQSIYWFNKANEQGHSIAKNILDYFNKYVSGGQSGQTIDSSF